MSNPPPTQLIGKFGEYFALNWLLKRGYDIRSFDDLSLAFDRQLPEEADFVELPISEEEHRRRRIQSLTDRIPHLENDIRRVESSKEAYRHKRWLANHKMRLEKMKIALAELKAGKPLNEIDDPEASWTVPPFWRVYKKQEMQEKDARSFLGSKVNDFLGYIKECENIWKRHGIVGSSYHPDMVAKKDGKYYVIEVKANDSNLGAQQHECLMVAQQFGFEAKVLRVKFEATCDEETVA